jgi:hypothetical protein
MKYQLTLLIAVGFLGMFAGPAAAVDGPMGCYGGWGGWAWGWGNLYDTLDDRVPYYAAYPPVYYSYPVPRTYGYSPFAYPPGTPTPDVVVTSVEPVTILNPYIKDRDSAAAAPEEKVTTAVRQVEPLVIVNPYTEGGPSVVQVAQ